MRAYLETARRYGWAIVIVLALTWGAGGAMGYVEYTTSFEADATIWTDRQSQQFATLSPQDPGLSSFVTPAQQQAGLLSQLLQTRSFLQQIVQRASVSQPEDTDERTFFQGISRRYRVDVLGTNLFRLSYRASDPRTGPAMVLAALAVRQERLAETRTAATAAAATFYRTELDVAQNRVLDAQRELAAFDQTHRAPLSTTDDYSQRQLRFTVEGAKERVAELRSRIDSSGVLPDILRIADALDFQVIDNPLDEVKSSGGMRPAAMIAGSAGAAGLALVGLLLICGTLLVRSSAGKSGASARGASEGDVPSPSPPATSANTELVNPGSLTYRIALISTERTRVARSLERGPTT